MFYIKRVLTLKVFEMLNGALLLNCLPFLFSVQIYFSKYQTEENIEKCTKSAY